MITDIVSYFYLIIVRLKLALLKPSTQPKVAWLMAYNAEETGYQLMDDFDFSLKGTDYILFELRSCSEVQMLLMHNKTNFQTELYQIKIDGFNDSKSVINKDRSEITAATTIQAPLQCDSIRTFWITWGGAALRVRRGTIVGKEEFMAFNDTRPVDVKHLSVSSGFWVFYSSNCACCLNTPRYCQGLQDSGITESGIYSVPDVVSNRLFEVYCDMETDGGGWLVFQRRKDGSEEFYRGWDDYENGFGNLSGEFWLGNRHLSTIISHGHYELRIDLEDWEGNKRYAKYHTFKIGNSCDNYMLTVFGYSGDAGDSMAHHNRMPFSTKDRDNDDSRSTHCARTYVGAWWYSSCLQASLNGLYLKGKHRSYANSVIWRTWTGYHYSLKVTEMKMREIYKT